MKASSEKDKGIKWRNRVEKSKWGKGTAQTFGCGQAALEQGPLLNEAIPAAGDTLIFLKTQKILQGRLVAIFCGLLGALLIANLVVNSGSKVFAIHLQIKARVPVELLFQVHLLRFPEKLAPILIAEAPRSLQPS